MFAENHILIFPNIEVPFTYLIKSQSKSSNTFFKSDSLALTKWAISTASKIVGYRGQRTKKTSPAENTDKWDEKWSVDDQVPNPPNLEGRSSLLAGDRNCTTTVVAVAI